jgi:hypothetical protein
MPITVNINDLLIKTWYEALITSSSYDNYFLPSQNGSNEAKISATTPAAKCCCTFMAAMHTYDVGMTMHYLKLGVTVDILKL